MDDLLNRLTSRKFIVAAVAAVVSVLAAAGVIDPTQEQTIIAQATPVVYIVVEGILDFVNRNTL